MLDFSRKYEDSREEVKFLLLLRQICLEVAMDILKDFSYSLQIDDLYHYIKTQPLRGVRGKGASDYCILAVYLIYLVLESYNKINYYDIVKVLAASYSYEHV